MLENIDVTGIFFNSLIQTFNVILKACEPHIISALAGAIFILFLKSAVGKVVEFFHFESSPSDVRKAKRKAFKLIDFTSALCDLFNSDKR